MQKRGHQPREREACLPARVTNVSVAYLLQPPHPVWIASVWAHVCICLQTHGYAPLWHNIRKVIGTPGLKIKQINTIIHTQWVKSIWCLNIHRCYSVSAERQRSSGKTEPKGHRCMAPLKPWTMTGRLNEVSLSHWTLRDFPVTRGNQAASNNLPAKVSILDTRPLIRAKQHNLQTECLQCINLKTTDMLHLYISSGQILYLISWQLCAYDLVRFRHKHKLVWIGLEKRSCFGLQYLLWSPRSLLRNLIRCPTYKCWNNGANRGHSCL